MNVKMGKIAQTYINSMGNNKDIALSTLSKPEKKQSQNQDSRFKNPRFREAVKTVLWSFGFDRPTYADFKNYEAMFNGHIDWLDFADRIERPRFTARCWIIDPQGKRHGVGRACLDLFGLTRVEALRNIPSGYEFIEWF